MSNAILPIALMGSMMSSVAGVAYGVQTEWGFMGTKDKEPEVVYVPPPPVAMGGGGSMIVDDFVIQGDSDEGDVTSILDEEAFQPALATAEMHAAIDGDDNIQGLSAMPVGCEQTEDGEQTALTGFNFMKTTANARSQYNFSCASLENPGDLKFGTAGQYKSSRGDISDLHQAQALCANNQALVGFVLDQNKSKSKLGYRYDCVGLKGSAKIRTALTPYKKYNDTFANQTDVLNNIGEIKCNEEELLQGFAVEKSGNNMRYIYRCVTPAYEAD